MAPPREFHDVYDATTLITIICAALAGYNAFELILLIFTTFNSYSGLYFYSMVIATFAIVPYTIGMEIMYFAPSHKLPGLIINNVGWILMVVFQSVVLYSRLGIVLGNMKSKVLFFTKWMIIIDAIVFYTIATVIVFGMQYSSNRNFTSGYIYSERIQMTGFCIQEFIISGLYIWKILDILKAGEKKQAHRTLTQLFTINVVIVGLDVALLVMEYLNLAAIEIAFKALAYSVKLKLEFAILSKLVESSSIAHQNMSINFHNTIALNTDEVNDAESSPETIPSTFRAWSTGNDDNVVEKGNKEHAEHKSQSHESFRTASHQTQSSERCLLGTTQSLDQSTLRKQSDPYHDVIRFMAT